MLIQKSSSRYNSSKPKQQRDGKSKHREVVKDIDGFLSQYKHHEGTDKIQCDCPFCIKYGEPSMKPTLNYYKNTGTMFCFRCDTFVFTSNSVINSRSEDDLTKLLADDYEPVYSNVRIDELSDWSSDPDLIDYITNKRSINYKPILDYLNVKLFTKHVKFNDNGQLVDKYDKGILLPFKHNGNFVSYQIRYLNRIINDNELKWHTKKGDKILFRIEDSYSQDEISIGEGVFDAIGLWALGFKNPVGVLGKKIPQSVLYFLNQYKRIKVVNLCLDEVSINIEIARVVKHIYKNAKIFIWSFKSNGEELDPDEAYRKGVAPSSFEYNTEDYFFFNKLNGVVNNTVKTTTVNDNDDVFMKLSQM